MEWINEAGKVAGSISAILALLALILFKPIKAHIKGKQDKKRRELKQRYEMELEDRETAAEFRREMRDGMNACRRLTSITWPRDGARVPKKKCFARCTKAIGRKAAITCRSIMKKKYCDWTANPATRPPKAHKHRAFLFLSEND